VLARADHDTWSAEGRSYCALTFKGPAMVRLVEGNGDTSEECGPYLNVSVSTGSVRADGKLIARYNRKRGYWRHYVRGSRGETVMIDNVTPLARQAGSRRLRSSAWYEGG
jgi:hypothetical protein